MKYSRLIFTSLLTVALSGTGWCQLASTNRHPQPIPGYLNPETGAFAPLIENSEISADTATTYTGTITVNFSITVKSSIPNTSHAFCVAAALVEDVNPVTFRNAGAIQEYASAPMVRSSNRASCTVVIPYSWLLSYPSTDTVGIDYTLEVEGSPTDTLSRELSEPIATILMPSNGTTTVENVDTVF